MVTVYFFNQCTLTGILLVSKSKSNNYILYLKLIPYALCC